MNVNIEIEKAKFRTLKSYVKYITMSSLTTKIIPRKEFHYLGVRMCGTWQRNETEWRLMRGLADGEIVVLFPIGVRTFPPLQSVQSILVARSASYAVDRTGFLPVTK